LILVVCEALERFFLKVNSVRKIEKTLCREDFLVYVRRGHMWRMKYFSMLVAFLILSFSIYLSAWDKASMFTIDEREEIKRSVKPEKSCYGITLEET